MEIYTTRTCPACKGKSKICPVCGGTGSVCLACKTENKPHSVYQDDSHKRPSYEDDKKHDCGCDSHKRPSYEDDKKHDCGDDSHKRPSYEDDKKCCPVCGDDSYKRPFYEDDKKHDCGDDSHKRPSCEDDKKCCPVCGDDSYKRPSYEDDKKHDCGCDSHKRPFYEDDKKHDCECDSHKRPSYEDDKKHDCGCDSHKRPPYEDDKKHDCGCDSHKRPSYEDDKKHDCGCDSHKRPSYEDGSDRCPVCDTPPAPFRNTASAAGRYCCAAGCRGDVSAVSAPVYTDVVDVTLDKAVSCPCARAGQTVRYTITVCNRSSIPVCRVCVTDRNIEDCLKIGTICLNGKPVPHGSLCRGIQIPGIGAGCCAAITFDATVPEDACGTICNTACAEFEFDTDCGSACQRAVSNEVVLSIVSPCLEIHKKADRCAVSTEENVVTYTLTACNTGTCPIENVVVTDVLPAGLTYVPCSTSVRGGAPINRSPAAGICLGTLCVGESACITFQAYADFEQC